MLTVTPTAPLPVHPLSCTIHHLAHVSTQSLISFVSLSARSHTPLQSVLLSPQHTHTNVIDRCDEENVSGP